MLEVSHKEEWLATAVMVDMVDEVEEVGTTTRDYHWPPDHRTLLVSFTRLGWGKCDLIKDRTAAVTTQSEWEAATMFTIGIKPKVTRGYDKFTEGLKNKNGN